MQTVIRAAIQTVPKLQPYGGFKALPWQHTDRQRFVH